MKAALSLIALAAAGTAVATPPGDPARGERAFQKCYSCHSVAPGDNVSGPSLHGVVGSPIAAVPGFPYSAALRQLAREQQSWTPELLDRFIADPETVAPGTEMGFFTRTSPQERADLIAWLRSQSQPGGR